MGTSAAGRSTRQKLLWCAAICLALLGLATQTQAQVAAGYSEYFIPGPEGDMYTVLSDIGGVVAPTDMHAVISVTAWSDGTILYYDHWENDYTFDPANPGSAASPVATTDEYYTLNTGQRMVFESNNMVLPRTTSPPTNTCDNSRNGVAVGTSTTCYDGRDRIYVAGGIVTVSRVGWIENRDTAHQGVGYQAVAWEIYPVKPQLTTYILPFGENLRATFGWSDFDRVAAIVQATTDNTTVQVDVDGDETFDTLNLNRDDGWDNTGDGPTVVLNKGETFILDRISACRNHAMCTSDPGDLSTGAIIQGSETLQVKYVAGDSNANYSTRGFSAFPRGFWTKDYYAPLDQPNNVTGVDHVANADYYLYNPHATDLTISWQSRTASGAFNVPANSTRSYRTEVGPVPIDSGLLFHADDVFWGVGVNDANSYYNEWGYSLLPVTMLSTEHFLGWAPDGYPVAAGQTQMGVFLTVTQDNTRVFVDVDNNGTPDQTYTLSRLQTQYITDPDGDLSGARFWATGPFAIAYGQNPDIAGNALPALDLGYVAIPGTDFISLVLGVDKSADPQMVPAATIGAETTFTVRVDSARYTVSGVSVIDDLPAGWDFADDSATITRPDKVVVSGAEANPTKTGTGPYTLTWPSALIGGNMAENQEILITFKARTTVDTFVVSDMSQNKVRANGARTVGGVTQTFNATDFAYVTFGSSYGNVRIRKQSSASTPLYPGDRFTYTTTVTNNGTAPITGVTLTDYMPTGVTYVPGSGVLTGCTGSALNVRDEFASVAYTNNGPGATASWSGPWTETDSLGGDAASGAVLVRGGVLRIGQTVNVRDQFGAIAYSNNDGSTQWANGWEETDAVAGGATGATGGFVYATGALLQFRYLASAATDDFATQTYTGGAGAWMGNWTEVNDDGTVGGTIRIDGSQRIEIRTGTVSGASIWRKAYVSGATSVVVSYAWAFANISNVAGADDLVAEFSANGGSSWTTLDNLNGGVPAQTFTRTIAWTPANSTIILRFRAVNALEGTDEARFDNVSITPNVSPANAVGTEIRRSVSLANATSATLSFDFNRAGLVAGVDSLVVEASSDGTTFANLATFNSATAVGTKSYNILAYASANTTIRFLVTGGVNTTAKTISIDNVDITASGTTRSAIQRSANLAGATSATLTFAYTGANLDGAPGADTMVVQASSDGTNFTTLETFTSATANGTKTYNLRTPTNYASANTTIRFSVTGGFGVNNEVVTINDLNIAYAGATGAADPPEFLSAGACGIPAGGSITLTFDVTVDDPLPTGLTEITNTASTTSTQFPIVISDSVTNIVANPSSLSATVAGRIWNDADNDGDQDVVGEPGFGNVEVTLKDRFGTPVATAVTDGTGRFLFPNVAPGPDYYVEVTNGLPAGLAKTFPSVAGDRTTAFILLPGQNYTQADIGYRADASLGNAAFGDLAWIDADSDGVRDAGEIGLGGVTVTLYRDLDGNGRFDEDPVASLVSQTITGPDGAYLFVENVVVGGNYFVIATTPASPTPPHTPLYTPTTTTVYDFLGVTAGSSYLTADFGFVSTSPGFTLSDRVWLDSLPNGAPDGAYDEAGGEKGIGGVTVQLLDSSLNVIGTTTTAADGTFSFSGLAGSGADYTTRISDTGNVLADYYGTTSFAIARQRAEDDLIANRDRTAASTTGPSYGFYVARSIGDTVFNDLNNNGVEDPGEPGIAGVVVTLYDASYNPLGSVTTDAAGQYLFSGLADGSYVVSVPALTGYTFTGPGGDVNGGRPGIQKAVTMAGSNILTVDFGFHADTPLALGGIIWNNTDGDGVVDPGEPRLAGVTVDVLSGTTVIATLSTDSLGAYSLSGIPPGTYTVRVTDTAGLLTSYSPNYEKTAGPYDYVETVVLAASPGSVNDVNFGYILPVVTVASVTSFAARSTPSGVTIEWQTSAESRTIGFYLRRWDKAVGAYVEVNEKLLMSVHEAQGGRYSYVDGGASVGVREYYELVEVEASGKLNVYGPYAVDTSLARPLRRASVAEKVSLEAEATGYGRAARARVARSKTVLGALGVRGGPVGGRRRAAVMKVGVGQSGIYRVDAGTASGAPREGVVGGFIPPTNVLTNRGVVVAVSPDRQLGGVLFYGQALDSLYARDNVYQLYGVRPGAVRMGIRQENMSKPPSGGETFTRTVHVEQDVVPATAIFDDPEGDYWLWDWIEAGGGSKSFGFRADGVAPGSGGEAVLSVRLKGSSETAANPDHHAVVSVNGQAVGELSWNGLDIGETQIAFDAGVLTDGANSVEIEGLTDTGAPHSLFYLDSFDVSYPSMYRALNNRLECSSEGNASFAIGGFTRADILVFDVTKPLRPVRVQAMAFDAGDGTYAVALAPPAPGTVYYAVTPDAVLQPTFMEPDEPSQLTSPDNGADYLLITTADLKTTAQQLADYRSDLSSLVVDIEDVYDEFGFGLPSPHALRAFLRYAYESWGTPPRYVVLVGDGSIDYKDVWSQGGNLIPPMMVSTPSGLYPSDVALADVDTSGPAPEMAIGRLPVSTVAELEAAIQKIKTREAARGQGWLDRMLVVADNPDQGGDFTTDSESLAMMAPSHVTVTRLYLAQLGQAQTRSGLLSGLSVGSGMVSYVGHAGYDVLADEGLLWSSDVATLTNAGQPTVMTAMTCVANHFALPGYPSLGELLVNKATGGAVAVWGPTGLSENDHAVNLAQGYYTRAFSGATPRLGDAIQATMKAYESTGRPTYELAIHALLGDPALWLPPSAPAGSPPER